MPYVNFNSLSEALLASNIFHFAFCIALVSYMIHALRSQNNSHMRSRFVMYMCLVLVYLFADMFSYIFDMQTYPGARIGNHISMFLSVLLTAYIGTTWLSFFDTIFRIDNFKIRRRLVYMIPTFLIFVMLIVNLFTGYVYEIGPDNVYRRGEGYWISFVLQYIGFFLIIIRALVHDLGVKTMRRRRMRNGMLLLSSLTIIFGVWQALMGGVIAVHCLGITVGLFIMFVRFQDDQITIDSLTLLNNRYALDSYIAGRMKDYAAGNMKTQNLYFLMMDVDKFKLVNDIYGHKEGDNVLRSVAEQLKKVGIVYKSKLFLSRYAGDEFAAVFETDNPKLVRQLVSDIKASVSEIMIEDRPLTISVGVSKYSGREMPLEQLFELADKALYIDKYSEKEQIEVE